MMLERNASYGDRGYTQRTPPLSRPHPSLSAFAHLPLSAVSENTGKELTFWDPDGRLQQEGAAWVKLTRRRLEGTVGSSPPCPPLLKLWL